MWELFFKCRNNLIQSLKSRKHLNKSTSQTLTMEENGDNIVAKKEHYFRVSIS